MKKSVITPTLKTFFIFIILLIAPMVEADEKPEASLSKDSKSSPWLVTPLVSSDPKISTAGGALAGYIHQFDEESPPSMFGVTGTYSTTDSWYLAAFAKTHFGKDIHRVTAAIATGKIHNDYSDFLGSGLDVQTTDDLPYMPCAMLCGFMAIGIWALSLSQPTTLYPETIFFLERF